MAPPCAMTDAMNFAPTSSEDGEWLARPYSWMKAQPEYHHEEMDRPKHKNISQSSWSVVLKNDNIIKDC